MLGAGVFETRSAKVIAAVVAVLLLAAFQVAVQAKPAHAYQVHISITGAGQVTETTPANLVGSGCVTSSTNPTGVVGKDCYAGTTTGNYGWGWDVTYVATAKPGYHFVQWQSDGSPNPVICDQSSPPATTSTYTSTTCKFKTFDNLQTRAVFVDDTAPPGPTITSKFPSSGYTNGAESFTFSQINDPTFKAYQCSVDSGAWNTCFSNQSYSLAEGSHTLAVRTIDYSDNISFGTSQASWIVDKTAPDTTLDPTVGPTPDASTQDNDPSFAFSSNEAGDFLCNLQGPGLTSTLFSACSTPKAYTNLKDGTYTFSVKARDLAGNVDSTPATRTWTINNTPTVLSNSLTPLKAATGVSRITNVSATFSEEMASVTLKNPDNTSSTFKLQQWNARKKKWIRIPATIALTNTNTTATLDPYGATEGTTEKPLAANKKFKATITTGVKDAGGTPLAKNFVWTFTTGSI